MSGLVLDLNKGMTLDLTKESSTIFEFGLSWAPTNTGVAADVDVSAFLMKASGGMKKLMSLEDVIYFKNRTHPSGAILLSEDSTDGAKEGDDEIITVDTSKIPSDVAQIRVYINIFSPRVSFREVPSAKAQVRVKGGSPIANFNMSTDFETENSILVGTVEKVNGSWSFVAHGEGYVVQDLNTIVKALNEEGVA